MTTARERAESVAHAISYCKDTLQRVVTAASLLPRPSLDDWLHDNDRRQDEETVVVASAAAYCNGTTTTQQHHRVSCSSLTIVDVECSVLQAPLPHRATMTQQHATGKHDGKEATTTRPAASCSPSRRESSWITANDVVHGKEFLPHHGHGHHHTIDNSRFLKPLISRQPALQSGGVCWAVMHCMQHTLIDAHSTNV
jgi:hypothetical protein